MKKIKPIYWVIIIVIALILIYFIYSYYKNKSAASTLSSTITQTVTPCSTAGNSVMDGTIIGATCQGNPCTDPNTGLTGTFISGVCTLPVTTQQSCTVGPYNLPGIMQNGVCQITGLPIYIVPGNNPNNNNPTNPPATTPADGTPCTTQGQSGTYQSGQCLLPGESTGNAGFTPANIPAVLSCSSPCTSSFTDPATGKPVVCFNNSPSPCTPYLDLQPQFMQNTPYPQNNPNICCYI